MGFISLEDYVDEESATDEKSSTDKSVAESDAAENSLPDTNEDVPGEFHVSLPESLTMDSAEAFYERIADIEWSEINKIVVDPAALKQLDFIGVQLLCSFKKTSDQMSVEFGWSEINQTVVDAAEEVDLKIAIGL